MSEFLSLLGIGATAFVATNIDDIFILMIFFSGHRFHDVVSGQYLGIDVLIAISAVGSIIAIVIPLYIIGIIRLIRLKTGEAVPELITEPTNLLLVFSNRCCSNFLKWR